MKKLIKSKVDKFILNYVSKNSVLQNDIVVDWSKGAEIATYHVKDSEVTIQNVNLLYSTITNCRINQLTNSILKDSPITLKLEED